MISPKNSIENIMDPLLHEMYQFLPIKDILNLSMVSSDFYTAMSRSSTWEFLIARDFSGWGGALKEMYKVCKMIREWKYSIKSDSKEAIWKLAELANYGLKIETFEGIPLIDHKLEDDKTDSTMFKKRVFYLLTSLTENEDDKIIGIFDKSTDSWARQEMVPSEILLGGREIVSRFNENQTEMMEYLKTFHFIQNSSYDDGYVLPLKHFNDDLYAWASYNGHKSSCLDDPDLVALILPIAKNMGDFFSLDTFTCLSEDQINLIQKLLPLEDDIILIKRKIR